MSGRMAWTGTEDFEVFAGRAADSFSVTVVRDRSEPMRALAGKADADEPPPPDAAPDAAPDADLDEDELGEGEGDDLEGGDDDDPDDDEELDDELIDLDDEYDDTDEADRPHPGHRYDD